MSTTQRRKITEELLQDMHAMRHKLMVGYTVKKEGTITPSQGLVLRFVAKNPSANVKAVAEALAVTSSAATQLIEGLVENGYLVRKGDKDDRRVIALSLSGKAKKLFKEFQEQGVLKMTKLFSALTDDELMQYAALNRKILQGLAAKDSKEA